MAARQEELVTVEERALDVLAEFVSDVDGAGVENMREEWPDLVVTYGRARAVLRLVGRKVGDEANVPPAGNAQPGDRAHWRETEEDSWKHDWVVDGVGLTNGTGQPLDILIAREFDVRQVSPFELSLLRLEPLAEQLPARLREFIGAYDDLFAARRPVNVEYFTYFVNCRRCMTLLDLRTSAPGEGEEEFVEESVFMFDETLGEGGAFRADSPVMGDGEEGLRCACRTYEEPDDVTR